MTFSITKPSSKSFRFKKSLKMRQVICVTERRGDKIVKNESAPIDLKFYVDIALVLTCGLPNSHAIWFSIHDIIGDLKISTSRRREGRRERREKGREKGEKGEGKGEGREGERK